MILYWDKHGEPISFDVWCQMFGDREYCRVDLTNLGDVEISTVWIGMDLSFGGPTPLIFETMIFGMELDQECWRYHTLEAAIAGHEAAIALVELEMAAK